LEGQIKFLKKEGLRRSLVIGTLIWWVVRGGDYLPGKLGLRIIKFQKSMVPKRGTGGW